MIRILIYRKIRKNDFLNLKITSKDLSTLVWENIQDSIEINTPEFLAIIDEKINDMISKIKHPKVSKEYLRFLRSKKTNSFGRKIELRPLNQTKQMLKCSLKILTKKYFF